MADIQIVELNLRHAPVIAGQDIAEHLVIIMEGKRGIADAAVLDRAVQKFQHAQRLHFFPALAAQRVQKIKVHIGHVQALELLVQQRVHILPGFHLPHGQLGGQLHALAVAVLEDAAHQRLALPIAVGIGRIDIAQPLIDGRAQHSRCARLVQRRGAVGQRHFGQTHHAKAQTGNIKTQIAKGYILHGNALL